MSVSREKMAEVLRKIQQQEDELRAAGQQEYAHKESNAFANFERVAAHLQTSREKILMVYLLKHIDGIVAWINGHKSQREDVRGRILDARVYLALLYAMVEDGPSLEEDIDRA